MQKEKQEPVSYTVERVFLSKITAEELVSHMIQSHIQKMKKKEVTPT